MNSKGIVLSLCDYSGEWSRPFIEQGYTVLRVDPMHDAGRMTTEGTEVRGSMAVHRMADGGYALAATAGQLLDVLRAERRRAVRVDYDSPPMFAEQALTDLVIGSRTHGEWLPVVGILMAPPCTHFSGSGARWWPAKDADGRTDEAVRIVRDCLALVDLLQPSWWALENPVGRIERLVPELQACPSKFIFDPCDYAGLADDPQSEAYTKRTVLWGKFLRPGHNAPMPRSFLRVEPVMIEKRRRDGSIVRGSWMWANLGGKSERTKALRSKTPQGFARAFALAQQVED